MRSNFLWHFIWVIWVICHHSQHFAVAADLSKPAGFGFLGLRMDHFQTTLIDSPCALRFLAPVLLAVRGWDAWNTSETKISIDFASMLQSWCMQYSLPFDTWYIGNFASLRSSSLHQAIPCFQSLLETLKRYSMQMFELFVVVKWSRHETPLVKEVVCRSQIGALWTVWRACSRINWYPH